MKNEVVFNEACNKVDDIKLELMQYVSKLEEVGMKRKAQSLDRIIGELEHWEHCR